MIRDRLFLAVVQLCSAAAWPRHDPALGCGRLLVLGTLIGAAVIVVTLARALGA